jgi:hypothetical protein
MRDIDALFDKMAEADKKIEEKEKNISLLTAKN